MEAANPFLALSSQPTAPANLAPPETLSNLQARDAAGFACVTGCAGLTTVALYLSSRPEWSAWLLGQVLLALSLVQCFALLHEAGHNTLFRTRWLNKSAGRLAGFLALIPFGSWKLVHGIHHKWTGWQDLDVTTAVLVPRRLSWLERTLVNVSWRTSFPLFAILYRWNNFWNLPRLFGRFPHRWQRRQLLVSTAISLAGYAALAVLVGPQNLLQLAGFGLILCLMIEDPLILSQHTHVPMHLSKGEPVQPFAPLQQELFTRSLRFPAWFSKLVLLGMDAHELHHMYPRVPGYRLDQIHYETHNEEHWWRWLRRAKRVPGEVFLFQNRLQSGHDI